MTAKAATASELPLDRDGAAVIPLPFDPFPHEVTAPAPVDNRAGGKAPRRYGKRKLPDARTAWVHVRCSQSEHAAITAKADKSGLTVGAYLRTLALGTPGPRAVRRPPVERAELARLLGELGKLGSNVNQIARVVNTTGNLRASTDLAALTADVQTMRTALMKALGRGD